METLTLRYDGDPCLRRVSHKVKYFDEPLNVLLGEMRRIIKTENGVGLAAPQVGVNTRVILVIDNDITEMINPEITWTSSEFVMMEEGCLSVPDHYIDIERPREIKVKFQTRDGKYKKWKLKGLQARIVLHEVDHLDGKLMTDYE
jgi:peptide deformylase|tara:strand:- start:8757 stop:9191 length:435 start_codon:yes stop_codon:yes gene_type:complete